MAANTTPRRHFIIDCVQHDCPPADMRTVIQGWRFHRDDAERVLKDAYAKGDSCGPGLRCGAKDRDIEITANCGGLYTHYHYSVCEPK